MPARVHPPGSQRPLRVVSLLQGFGRGGGAEQLAVRLLKGLDPERFERTLVVSRWTPELQRADGVAEARADLERAGVRFIGMPRRGRFDLASWRPLIGMLRREQTDILHSHMFGSNVWGTIVGRLAGVPGIVAHEHSWTFEGRPVKRFLDRELIARFSGAFVAVSREDRRRMIEIEHIDPSNIVLIPNGVPTSDADAPLRTRADVGFSEEQPLIGCASILRPEKRLDLLLRAVARVSDDFPDLGVMIAGFGPEREGLEAMARSLGVAERVKFLGYRDDIPSLLPLLDVAVCCSEREGSPLSVMEYMEAGLPVVSTAVGGIPDLIEHDRHGLLIEPHDELALAEAIARLLSDRAHARELGAAARKRRTAEFDISRTVERFSELYESLLPPAR